MIASHYAEPLDREIGSATQLLAAPAADADLIVELGAGDRLQMLDCSRGWAWGYAGAERRVGYVRADALAT